MQEVIGSTPIFSTKTLNTPGVQLFSNTPGVNSAKTLPQHANFGGMESAEVIYTTPRLVKGKNIDFVPKGSTKAKEEGKQNWYVECAIIVIDQDGNNLVFDGRLEAEAEAADCQDGIVVEL